MNETLNVAAEAVEEVAVKELSNLAATAIGFVAGVATTIGASFVVKAIKKKKELNALNVDGTPVDAEDEDFEEVNPTEE